MTKYYPYLEHKLRSKSGYSDWAKSVEKDKKEADVTKQPVVTAAQSTKEQSIENKKTQWYMERVDFEDLPRLKGQEIFLIPVNRRYVWKKECNQHNVEVQTVAEATQPSCNSSTLHFATGKVCHFQRSYWTNLSEEYVLPYVRVLPGVTLRLLDFHDLGGCIPGSKFVVISQPKGGTAPRFSTIENRDIMVFSGATMINGVVKVATEWMIIDFSLDMWSINSPVVLPYVPCDAKAPYTSASEELAKQIDKKILDSLRGSCERKDSAQEALNKIAEHLNKIMESEDEPDKDAEAYLPNLSRETKIPKKEKFMSGMKELGNIFVEGVKIHSSGDVARKIVEVAKGQLKETYPKMLSDNDLGRALAPVLIPALIYVVAKNYCEENPTMEKAANVCEYALLGASKDLVEYANKLIPLFSSVAALTTLIESEDDDDDD